MTALVVRSDAAHLPLPDNSVDLVVTSPPYFALRSYQDGGEHYAHQIGSEATPQEFLEALWTCTAEWMRVLKPSGSIFVNLGDKYAGGGMGGHSAGLVGTRPQGEGNRYKRVKVDTPNKSLMLMPERYRIGCVDRLGLIARSVIIWDKPNGLPESVTDRVRRSHEDWVHLTLAPRYFSAMDEVREPHAPWTLKAYAYEQANHYNRRKNADRVDEGDAKDYAVANPLGKLPGSVWRIATEPLNVPDHLGVDHFAAFPTEWPRRIIQGWSPAGICTVCGEGRRPVSDKQLVDVWHDKPPQETKFAGQHAAHMNNRKADGDRMMQTFGRSSVTITGYACACPSPDAPTRPAVVLDPFGGTGTTALCASVLGRIGISVDLSHDYSRLAQWRTQDPGQRAKTIDKWHRRDKKRGLDRPPVVDPLAPPEPPPYVEPTLVTLFDDGDAA